MDSDFDSSDIEFDLEEQPTKRRATGDASVMKIIDNAAQERLDTKKFVKTMGTTTAVKGTIETRELWSRRFDTFRKHTLKVSENVTPNGEQILRFIAAIPNFIEARSPGGLPSVVTLKGGVRILLWIFLNRFDEFRLSHKEREAVFAAFRDLTDSGKITDEPRSEDQWIGVSTLRVIIRATIEDALLNGTLNWDVPLSWITLFVLQSAMCSRIGEIARDGSNTARLPFLAWQDIILRFDGGSEPHNLMALITIRNAKGKRHSPNENSQHVLRWLNNTADNLLCPIKLLLVLALRTGQIENATTIDEALMLARQRESKRIVWKNPERHVISATLQANAGLAHDRPLTVCGASGWIKNMGTIAGFVGHIRTHNIRYGAARDLAHLPGGDRLTGTVSETAALGLGHTPRTRDAGITKKYVGPDSNDTWALRVSNHYDDPYAPVIATPPPRAKKRTKAQVNDRLRAEGVNPATATPAQRSVANRRAARRANQTWVETIRAGMDAAEPDNTVPIDPDLQHTLSIHLPTIDCDGLEFIKNMARINVTKNTRFPKPGVKGNRTRQTLLGSGKDLPTFRRK